MRLSYLSKAVVVLFTASQAVATITRRQSTDVASIPAACESTCEPLFNFQSDCAAEDSGSVAKCLCVPEFVTYSSTCSSCVVEHTTSTTNTNTTAAIQKGIDDALEEFLAVCKDELGVDLTTVNSFAPASDNANSTSVEAGITGIGPAAAAAVNPNDNSGATRVDSLAFGFLVAVVGSVVLWAV